MEINIKYNCIYGDIIKAQLLYFFKIGILSSLLTYMVFLVLIGQIVYMLLFGYSDLLMAGISVYVFLVCVIIYKFFILPLIYCKKNYDKEVYYKFSESGFEINTEKTNAKYIWEFLIKVVETKDLFLFFYKKNTYLIVPKRCFENSEDVINLENILDENGIDIILL